MAAGCPERFDWEFIRWILWDGRTKNAKERYRNIRSTYPDKFITLKNQKELDSFLNNIKNDLLNRVFTSIPVYHFLRYLENGPVPFDS